MIFGANHEKCFRHCENLQTVAVQIRGNLGFTVIARRLVAEAIHTKKEWIATTCFCKSRNDGTKQSKINTKEHK